MTCVSACPDHFYGDSINQICVSNCSIISQYVHLPTKMCRSTCPDSLFADPTTYVCVAVCPFGYYG